MSDNIIKFRRPQPPKAQNPWRRKLLVIAIMLIVFGAAWSYFHFTGQAAG